MTVTQLVKLTGLGAEDAPQMFGDLSAKGG
jgi:hypothetical protein